MRVARPVVDAWVAPRRIAAAAGIGELAAGFADSAGWGEVSRAAGPRTRTAGPRPPGAAGKEDMDWRSAAACTHEDPELFFPVGNSGPAREQIDQAKSVCRRCPVIDRCLSWAMATKQESGVWGGLSEDERRALRRRNTRRQHNRHAA